MALGSAINIRPIERELKWLNTQFGGIAGTPVTNTLQWRFQSLLNHLPIWYGRNAEQHLVPSFVTNPVVGQKLIAHGIPTGAITKVPDEEGHRLQYFLWNMTAGGTVDNRLLVRGHYGLSDEQVIADTDWHPVLSYGYHLRSGCGLMKMYVTGKVSEDGAGQIRVNGQTTDWDETEYTTKNVWTGIFQPDEAVLIEATAPSGEFTVRERWFDNEKLRIAYQAGGMYEMATLAVPLTFEVLQEIEVVSEVATSGDHFVSLYIVRRLGS